MISRFVKKGVSHSQGSGYRIMCRVIEIAWDISLKELASTFSRIDSQENRAFLPLTNIFTNTIYTTRSELLI